MPPMSDSPSCFSKPASPESWPASVQTPTDSHPWLALYRACLIPFRGLHPLTRANISPVGVSWLMPVKLSGSRSTPGVLSRPWGSLSGAADGEAGIRLLIHGLSHATCCPGWLPPHCPDQLPCQSTQDWPGRHWT